MNKNLKSIFDWLFRGKDKRLHIAQFPNLPIAAWFVFMMLAKLDLPSALHSGFLQLSTAFLAIWCYLEITKGDSKFRRILGAIVALVATYSLFA